MLALPQTDEFPGGKHLATKVTQRSTADEGRIGETVRIIRKVGGEKVGFLGLAFAAGTEDFCESPILEVMKILIDEGLEVIAYEPTVHGDKLVDVRPNCSLYGEVLRVPATKSISRNLCESAANVVDGCETLVVTYHTKELQKLIASRCGRCNLIDLVDLFSEQSSTSVRTDIHACYWASAQSIIKKG